MATIGIFSDSYAFDIELDATTGLPKITNPEQSFFKALTNRVMGNFTGGKTGAVGLGNTAGFIVEQWAGATITNLVHGDKELRLLPWKQA